MLNKIKKQITHDNHYVPQFYLRNWSKDGNNILTYPVLVANTSEDWWKLKPIKSSACFKDLYTREINGEEIADFEDLLQEYEYLAKNVIDKIIAEKEISTKELYCLVEFYGVQYMRTPARLSAINTPRMQKSLAAAAGAALKETMDDLKNPYHKNKNESNDPGLDLLPFGINREGDIMTIKTIIGGKGTFLMAIDRAIQLTEKYLKNPNYRWHIIHAADKINWPTSDNPAMCVFFNEHTRKWSNGGWAERGCELMLPLSPKHLLYSKVGYKADRKKLEKSEEFSKRIDDLIIQHSFRYIYALERKKFMWEKKPRTANAELLQNEREQYMEWHKNQIELEDELKKRNTKK